MESAQGPHPSFFLFIQLLFDLGACWDQDLDQGLTIADATRPGVQQSQAQGQVFCPWLGSTQDRTGMC